MAAGGGGGGGQLSEIGNLIVSRPEKSGIPTLFLFSHKAGSVDFKYAPCKKLEDGTWEYCETMEDPETTGYFKAALDGSSIDIFAAAPKKWCLKFVKEADGTYRCTNDGLGTTAVNAPPEMKPAPSKIGAGGLPKGQVNLGDQDEEFNMLF